MFVFIWLIVSLPSNNDALRWVNFSKHEGYSVGFNEDKIRAEAGLCAVIPCAFTSLFVPERIIWYKCKASNVRCDKSERIFHSDENEENIQFGFKGRVSLLNLNMAQKNCSMMINNLKKSDSGSYQLRVEGKETGEAFTYETKTTLSVTGLNQKPSVMIPPLTEGQQATLTCTAPGLCSGSPPNITWMWRGKGGKDYFIKGNITALKTDNLTAVTQIHISTLTFNSSADHHNTKITCKVSFTGGLTTEETVTLNVTYARKPQISVRSTVKEGNNLNLTCSVDSFPLSVITWTKSGKQAEQQSHNVSEMHGSSKICQQLKRRCLFSISNVTKEDAGLYICTAQHLNNTLREEINVTVKYARKPQISGRATVMEGDDLNLTCSVDSVPPSVIKWTKSGTETNWQDNILIKADNRKVYLQEKSGHVSLSIMNVTTEEAGRYICTATYQNDSMTEEVHVKVNYLRKPWISGRTTVKEGDVLNLTCSADSFPLSVINWTKMETKTNQQPSNSAGAFNITEKTLKGKDGNGSLSNTNVAAEDSRVYICTAKNLTDNLTKQVKVTVTYDFENATVKEEDLNLNCSVDSFQPLVVRWTKNGTETNLKIDTLSKVFTAVYVLYEQANVSSPITNETMEDAKRYVCTAAYQKSTMEEKLHIVTSIGKPQISGKTTAEEDALSLTCTVDSFSSSVINLTIFENSNLQTNISSKLQSSSENLKQEQSGIGTLFIKSVTAEHAGLYICTATVPNINLTERINLTVTYRRRPQITGNQTIKEGDALNLTCSVDSVPPSLIMWTKNVLSMHPSNRTSSPNNTGSATLVVFNMTVGDSGRYTCTATYENITETKYVHVKVTWSPKVLNGSGCVLRTDALTCMCLSEGFPLPTIQWPMLKDHTEYSITSVVSNHTVNSTVTITVKNHGNISVECVSSNENGEAKENLTVFWTKREVSKQTPNSGKSSMLEIIIAFLVGFLLAPIIFCLFMKFYRIKRKNSENAGESVEMIMPLMSNGQAVQGGEKKEALAGAPEATNGPKELVYANIDFSLLNRVPTKRITSSENKDTEYAEIKTNKEKGHQVQMMTEEDNEMKSCVQEVKEEAEEPVYAKVEDLVEES